MSDAVGPPTSCPSADLRVERARLHSRVLSSPPPPLDYAHGTLRITSTGVVVVARWLAAPTAADVRLMRFALRPYVGRLDAFCSLNVVDIEHATPMADDARKEVAQTQREFEGRQRGLANVIEGRGFWAASIRSVASGLALLSRVKFEQRIFDAVDPAALWLETLFPIGTIDVPAVLSAAARLRFDTR